MAKGPIRNRERTGPRVEREPASGSIPTTDGALVPLAPSVVPVAPTPVDPKALAARWQGLEDKAVEVLDDGVNGRFEDPAHQRERRQAAEAILGVRRGGLPMPAIGGAIRRATATERTVKLTWADGRPIIRTLHEPRRHDQPHADDDDDDE